MKTSWANSKLLFPVKSAISLGLLAYLVFMVDWQRALRVMDQANKLLLLASPFCLLAGFVISSSRWLIVLADSKIKFAFRQAYGGYLIGAFYSIFLPGVVGGDAVRVGLCIKNTQCEPGIATASVMLERIGGVLVLFGFLLLFWFSFPWSLSPVVSIKSTCSVTPLVTITVMAIAALILGLRVLGTRLPNKAAKGAWRFIQHGIQALANLRFETLTIVLVLSALCQALNIFAVFLLSKAIGLGVSLSIFFGVIPLVYIATVFPISLGGLGVREGTLVLLLTQFNVARSDAVTLSLLIYLNLVLIACLGGLIQLIGTLKTPVTQQKPEY